MTMDAIVDANLMLLALRNLVRAAEAAARHTKDQRITDAVDKFTTALPGIVDMRDVVEHFDDYLDGKGKLQKKLRSPSGLPYFETFQRQPGVFELLVTPKFTLNVGNAAETGVDEAGDRRARRADVATRRDGRATDATERLARAGVEGHSLPSGVFRRRAPARRHALVFGASSATVLYRATPGLLVVTIAALEVNRRLLRRSRRERAATPTATASDQTENCATINGETPMLCPNCGSEMQVRPGLAKVWYCSEECGMCIEDVNLDGAANRLAGLPPRHAPVSVEPGHRDG